MSEYNDPLPRQILSGAQMLFVAFGALVLMPLITGMDPNVALFTAGIGTLLFQLATGRQVPVFLASSFAFIAPIIAAKGEFGMPAVLGGVVAAGFVYTFLGLAVKLKGPGFIDRVLPPVVIGPVIIIIGLSVAGVAAASAPPMKKRRIARCSQLPAPAWKIHISAQIPAQTIKPIFRPMTSISQPHRGWKMV